MRKINLFLLCLILFLSILSSPVQANGGPGEPSIYDGDGGLHFLEDTGVQLVSEKIQISFTEEKIRYSHVEVTYLLRETKEAESLTMYFALPQSGEYYDEVKSYRVIVDGDDISKQCLMEELPDADNWESQENFNLVDPITEEALDVVQYTKQMTYGIQIPLSFDKEEEIELVVEYDSLSGVYYDRVSTVYSYLYYMTPATFWLGDPEIYYSVQFPKGLNYKVHSNLELSLNGEDFYEGSLSKLPDEEWQLTYARDKGLIFDTNNLQNHNRILYGFAGLIILVTLILRIRYKKSIITIIGYILIALIMIYLVGNNDSNEYSHMIARVLRIIMFGLVIPIYYIGFWIVKWIVRGIRKYRKKRKSH